MVARVSTDEVELTFTSANGIVALPVCDRGTCSAHDGNEGSHIPKAHDRVAHDVCAAGSEECVTEAVTPAAVLIRRSEEGIPAIVAVM